MSVSVEVRWWQSVADSVLKHTQSAPLKFQRGIGLVSVYSPQLGEELLLGDVAVLECFHQFCLYHTGKTLSLDWWSIARPDCSFIFLGNLHKWFTDMLLLFVQVLALVSLLKQVLTRRTTCRLPTSLPKVAIYGLKVAIYN